jgi:hypothetical protein
MNTPAPPLGQICIQVHLGRAPALDRARLTQVCEQLARLTPGVRGMEVSDGDEDGPFINIALAAENPVQAWRQLGPALLESPEFGATLKAASLWMCTGDEGWDDYRLLYHYDPAVESDELPED